MNEISKVFLLKNENLSWCLYEFFLRIYAAEEIAPHNIKNDNCIFSIFDQLKV